MGAHSLEELLRLYTLEKITVEMAMGQVLQHLQRMNAALERLEKLEQEIERLKAFVGMEPETKGKKKEKRGDQGETGD